MAEDDIEALKAQMRDLGPIEDFIQDLATEEQRPTLAVGVCLVRIDEAAPALLAGQGRRRRGPER